MVEIHHNFKRMKWARAESNTIIRRLIVYKNAKVIEREKAKAAISTRQGMCKTVID